MSIALYKISALFFPIYSSAGLFLGTFLSIILSNFIKFRKKEVV
jgi:hypothetical protein